MSNEGTCGKEKFGISPHVPFGSYPSCVSTDLRV